MTKRERVHDKFGGRCTYCGCILPSRWHIDHAEPLSRSWTAERLAMAGRKKGNDEEANQVPACPRCNLRKAMMTVEEFRSTIQEETAVLRRYSTKFRLAEDFWLIVATGGAVVFWFEKYMPEGKEEER
jgi:5-methylcytosine-specific restriction endonuclease McrA